MYDLSVDFPMSFLAQTESGRGRGRTMNVPTINLSLDDVHPALDEGVYACFATINGKKYKAAMHLGPRPVFKDSKTCEIHLIDDTIAEQPETLAVEVIAYLRPVMDFPSADALVDQIRHDVDETRTILGEPS